MKFMIGLAAVLALVLVSGCGGDNPTIARPVVSDNNNGGEPSRDVGERAPQGRIILQVDGKTFSATISECARHDNGSFTVVPLRGETEIGVSASRVGSLWAISAGVTIAGQTTYMANSAGGVTPAVDGDSLAFTMEFGRLESNGIANVGAGRVSATCPPIAVAANPGGRAEPNSIQIGDRVWHRVMLADVGQCFLQEASQGMPESATAWGYVDENRSQRFNVGLSEGKVTAQLTGATFFWVAGAESPVNDLEIELDYATQTIRGSGTFANAIGGGSEFGSFEFTCEN